MIRALVLDVDGVLSDGGVILDAAGGEAKRFHTRDGVGIKLAQHAGWRVLFLTARDSEPARRRARELGAEWATGIAHKEAHLEAWLAAASIPWEQTAYVGDDLPDLGVMMRVGWPVAVGDAVEDVKRVARHVTAVPGGAGAVRDAVEWLLERTGELDRAKQSFLHRPTGFSVGEEATGGPAPS